MVPASRWEGRVYYVDRREFARSLANAQELADRVCKYQSWGYVRDFVVPHYQNAEIRRATAILGLADRTGPTLPKKTRRDRLVESLRLLHADLHADQAASVLDAARAVARVFPLRTTDGLDVRRVARAARDLLSVQYRSDAADALRVLAAIPGARAVLDTPTPIPMEETP
jgi:hypothetical protein